MRIAFIMRRKNYYRLLGPAVEEGLRRGWRVECWHDWSQPRGGAKGSEFLYTAPTMAGGPPEVRTFLGFEDLAERFRADSPDVVVTLDPPPPATRAASAARGCGSSTRPMSCSSRRPGLDADAVGAYSMLDGSGSRRLPGDRGCPRDPPQDAAVGMPEPGRGAPYRPG
jgi:hypothetical protein